jgi:hypothetical protein
VGVGEQGAGVGVSQSVMQPDDLGRGVVIKIREPDDLAWQTQPVCGVVIGSPATARRSRSAHEHCLLPVPWPRVHSAS